MSAFHFILLIFESKMHESKTSAGAKGNEVVLLQGTELPCRAWGARLLPVCSIMLLPMVLMQNGEQSAQPRVMSLGFRHSDFLR